VHPGEHPTGEQFKPEFLAISPNNRIPALVDSDGPDGKPISLFESGAILIYLAEQERQACRPPTADRYEVVQWLMWQMGGVGPMFGQANHFRAYAKEKQPLCDRALHERVAASLPGARRPARGPGVRRGRVFDRRHGDLPVAKH
jgi:glutathione S-transferase